MGNELYYTPTKTPWIVMLSIIAGFVLGVAVMSSEPAVASTRDSFEQDLVRELRALNTTQKRQSATLEEISRALGRMSR